MTPATAIEQTQVSGFAWAIAAGLLTLAATVAVWPAGTTLRRLQGRPAVRRRILPKVDLAGLRERTQSFAERHPRRALGMSALAGAVPGGIVAGPVGGFVLAAYGALAVRAAFRWAVRSRTRAMRARDLDDLVALAADLRAGLAGPPADVWPVDAHLTGASIDATAATGRDVYVAGALAGATAAARRDARVVGPLPDAMAATGHDARVAEPSPNDAWAAGTLGDTTAATGQPAGARPAATGAAAGRPRDARLAELTAAVWRLAERTGAPAADLIDRIEADARSADRSRAGAAAEAAGAQATALMMAMLPVGGIALGYGIGFDPLPVLLHTPLGAACAVGAVLLQCAGLLWSDRLASGPVR
jgi:tight adherence protein B